MSIENKKKKTIGIFNKGKNGTFIDNVFSGLDIGIQDEGENTFASGNKFNDGESMKKRSLFSMENPIVWIVTSLALIIVVAAICYWVNKTGFPLKFGSN